MATVHGHSIWKTARGQGAEDVFMDEHRDDSDDAARRDADGKWPRWMVTLGVVTFCSAFWSAAYYVWNLVL